MPSEKPSRNNGYFIQSVEAACKVAESFLTSGNQVMSLSDICAITGYTKNRVFRIASTLSKLGYMHKEENGTGYSLGASYLPLGEHVRNRSNLRQKAAPFLDEMVNATNDAAHLYTTIGKNMVCVINRIGTYMVQAAGTIGEHIPIHIGPGKIILANQPKDEIERYLEGIEITPFTAATITDKKVLLDELNIIRVQGYCVDHEEFEDGCHAYSAPIFDLSGAPIAAFLMTFPAARLSEDREQRVIQLTLSAARQLSVQMGYQR